MQASDLKIVVQRPRTHIRHTPSLGMDGNIGVLWRTRETNEEGQRRAMTKRSRRDRLAWSPAGAVIALVTVLIHTRGPKTCAAFGIGRPLVHFSTAAGVQARSHALLHTNFASRHVQMGVMPNIDFCEVLYWHACEYGMLTDRDQQSDYT